MTAQDDDRVSLGPEQAMGQPPSATPAVKPDDGPDDRPRLTLQVDAEVFSVRPGRQARSHDYTWLSGPNEGYGFSSRDSAPRVRSLEDHRESMREFLAMVDPQTGYIEDE